MNSTETPYAPAAYYTEFVSQDYIRQHKIKKVEMIITRESFNPYEQKDKGLLEGMALPGISTTYHFSSEGLLIAEENGMSAMITRYHYDESNQIKGREFESGDYNNFELADVRLKQRIKWTLNDQSENIKILNVSSACYEINADYIFQLNTNRSLPTQGRAKLLRVTGERYAEQYPETLDVYLRYELAN